MTTPKKRKDDIRILRPLAIHERKTKKTFILQQTEHLVLDSQDIYFYQPNNISIFISIAYKEMGRAHKIYTRLIKPQLDKGGKIEFKGAKLSQLYNYFEHIQSATISIYTAIEALANVAIPRNYTMEIFNNKQVKEIWSKENIERWKTTSEKIGDIVPSILKMQSPKDSKVWTYFKQLEQIRNDIIHQKSERDPTKLDSKFLLKLFKSNVFTIIQSGFEIIRYYCEKNESHGFFPIGFNKIKIEPIEIEDFKTHFAVIDEPKKKRKTANKNIAASGSGSVLK